MFFRDIDTESLRGILVFLDIDGTLVPNGGAELLPPEARTLLALKEKAKIYLVSNNGLDREPVLVARYGIDAIVTSYKKPSAHILDGIVFPDVPRVVIGDTFLTDGLFAKRIGATFIRVERLWTGEEGLRPRFIRALDETVCFFISAFSKLSRTTFWQFVRLARPRQWIKNLLILTPLFFAGGFFSWPVLLAVIFSALAFSFTASAGYVLNDLADREEDARHPKKRFRPLASGRISVRAGMFFFVLLLLVAAFFANSVPDVIPWLALYFAFQYLYSTVLRAIPVVEFIAVASFFVLRILAGGAVAHVPVSGWLLLTTFFAALFVTTGKRYSESKGFGARAVLRAYPSAFLEVLPAVSAVLAIVAYALYSVLGTTSHELVFSNLFVVFGILWYLRGIYAGVAEEPEAKLWNDLALLCSVGAWGVFLIVVLYGTVLSSVWQSIL